MPDVSCTSLSCTSKNCAHCSRCSHALYVGQGEDDEGCTHYWTFSPRNGPLFINEHGSDLEIQSEDEEDACWKPFEAWLEKRKEASQ